MFYAKLLDMDPRVYLKCKIAKACEEKSVNPISSQCQWHANDVAQSKRSTSLSRY